MQFEDKKLKCVDCGAEFVFSSREQEFFWSKNLSTPKRCKPCRQLRRAKLIPDAGVQK